MFSFSPKTKQTNSSFHSTELFYSALVLRLYSSMVPLIVFILQTEGTVMLHYIVKGFMIISSILEVMLIDIQL